MAESILRLSNVTKTYILGKRKSASEAQRAIHKLQKKYEKLAAKGNSELTKQVREKLSKAQTLFVADKFEASYLAATGKNLKKHRRERGDVVHALNNASLDIKKGELVAIMGPSGSGKSTLLNMLGLLDEPTAGEIYLRGRNITSIGRRELPEIRSRELGFVFQSFNLIPILTALENVMLPLKYAGIHLRKRKDIARLALERVGLGDRLSHGANELSGGQRQRVAIARSVVNNPAIVFGDEMTGELDSKMTEDVMKLVVNLNKKGQTFIIVTHNPDVAKHAKRIIYMRDGRIEKESPTLKSSP